MFIIFSTPADSVHLTNVCSIVVTADTAVFISLCYQITSLKMLELVSLKHVLTVITRDMVGPDVAMKCLTGAVTYMYSISFIVSH